MSDDDDLEAFQQRVWNAAVLGILVRLESTETAHHHVLSDLVLSLSKTAPPDAIQRMERQLEDARTSGTGALAEIQRLRELLNASVEVDEVD